MRLFNITFSPTGGTKKVADILAGCFHCDVVEFDLSYPIFRPDDTLCADDVCIIAVPSFGGRVPGAAAERLSTLNGCGARAILVAVYGNREFDDTLIELSDLAEAAVFRPIAAIGAIAEHSIVRSFAAGRPDSEDEAQLRRFAEEIHASLSSPSAPFIPGSHPYKEYKGSAAKPVTSDSCVSCGLCAKHCPVGAIPYKQPNETDLSKCISCMRCISLCPVGARTLSAEVLSFAEGFLSKTASERKENRLFI